MSALAASSERLRGCIDEAVAVSGVMLGRCMDKAVASLLDSQHRGGNSEQRQALSDAGHALLPLRSAWPGRFPPLLRAAASAGEPEPSTASRRGSEAAVTLALVDEAEVDQALESARLLTLLNSLVEPALAELDRLVSSELGLDRVRTELNPLRPAIFVQALRTLMDEGGHPRERQTTWLHLLAPTLGIELAALYRRQADLLVRAGVRPVSYRVVGSGSAFAPLAPGADPHGAAPPSDAEATASQPGSGASAASSSDPRIRGGSALANLSKDPQGQHWVRDFLHRSGDSGHAPLAPGYYARVASDLSELQALPPETRPKVDPQQKLRYRQLPVVDRPARQVSTDTPLDDATWGGYSGSRQRALIRTQLKRQAQKVDQVLGLELVRKLVNQVAQDPRLLTPVREAMVALEPALLRMALVEPRFFTDDRHPGRCLVERVAERSLRFNDEFSGDFKDYLAQVAGCVSALNGNEGCRAQDFSNALASLESAWSAWDVLEEQKRGQVLEAVQFAEKRQVLANEIARSMSERTDLADVPVEVQEFLYATWALVMAQARLTDRSGHVDPGAHGSVVTDLLWSVKRQSALRQPARLIALIPRLLERLRTGLDSLGQTAQESAAFFGVLERLHGPVLDWRASRRQKARPPLLEELLETIPPRSVARRQPATSDTPWLARRELEAAGFQDTVVEEMTPTTPQAPDEGAPEPEMPETPAPAQSGKADGAADAPPGGPAPAAGAMDAGEVERLMGALQQGCWVDLYSKQHWVRARLAWASNKATLFMFVGRNGQPHSMTRRICERLLRERLLRPLKMHGVVSHAIGVVGQPSRPSPLTH